ncbi:unnamed protein product [Darwinula stevensoni]|uniref:ABC transporter domain-containing protein n=1 Tax=Darwinula stevensoni TaxID=69355 RepID=A0A7R8XEX5_9CRUS|nr:unnamed protein product [Darwinula stevensoni]CAG0894694.1 unnamed protein product [Darwinula stevensoni]
MFLFVKDGYAVLIENGTLTWSLDEPPLLMDLHLRVPVGKLVAVVGQVGPGKFSLLSAFLGDMEKVSGLVNVMGEVAYVPQEAWFRNATVKDNVIFGKTYNDSFYKAILSLVQDLPILPASDMTETGEKGIHLSGGQKQRVEWSVYLYFLKSMSLSLSLVTILLHGISLALIINSNIALSKWAEMASLNHTMDTSQRNSYIAAYSALGLSYGELHEG